VEGFDPVQNTVLWKYPPESENKVTALAVSSDGSIVAIGDDSGKLLLLDGKNGQLLAELKGNFGSVQAIEFSHDDMKIATAGSDGAVRIFSVVNK
jgi:WD40 repeat protein